MIASHQRFGFLCTALFSLCAFALPVAAQDPGTPGPFAVTVSTYDFGDTAFTPTGFPGVELRGVVHRPSDLSQGPFPLLVFMHGKHATCFNGSLANMAWPCPTPFQPVPSFRGYDYMASVLASQGFIVVSISANGINSNDDFASSDGGALARAELLQRHLQQWRTFNTASTAPFGATFVGKVDLTRVGTMGHSRGGEGVVRHFILNQSQGSPFAIRAVLPLAPIDFNRFVINNVPIAVILPYCDGDVRDLQGVHYYDDARYNVASDITRKHVIYVHGANHNFFNTTWTPDQFAAGSSDDWVSIGALVGYPNAGSDAHCGTAAASRLSSARQRAFNLAYTAAFFRSYVANDQRFLPLLTGNEPAPASAQTTAVFVSYHAGSHPLLRRDINRFTFSSNLTTNTLGGAVTRSGLAPFTNCGGAAGPVHCISPTVMNPSELGYHQPHTTESVFAPVPGLAQVSLGWSALNATLSNAIPAGSRDVRGFSTVQFRASVNYTDARNPVGLPRDLSVVLTDGAGASASARVSDFSPALFYPPGQQFAVPKVFDNTVQLPLSAFSAINLGDVRTVVLRFDRQAAGALLITDLAFANPLGARVELTAFVGEATPLPLPAGQMNLEGTFQTAQPIDLSRATLTFQDVLQQSNGTELLTDVPISLKPLPGATPNNATYISLLVPGVTVVITSLVPNTYFVTMTLFNETIRLPSTCTLLGGVAQLTTSLAIDDGSVPVLASTTKTWVCAPSGAYMQAF